MEAASCSKKEETFTGQESPEVKRHLFFTRWWQSLLTSWQTRPCRGLSPFKCEEMETRNVRFLFARPGPFLQLPAEGDRQETTALCTILGERFTLSTSQASFKLLQISSSLSLQIAHFLKADNSPLWRAFVRSKCSVLSHTNYILHSQWSVNTGPIKCTKYKAYWKDLERGLEICFVFGLVWGHT